MAARGAEERGERKEKRIGGTRREEGENQKLLAQHIFHF
jgi:hypothetical protein